MKRLFLCVMCLSLFAVFYANAQEDYYSDDSEYTDEYSDESEDYDDTDESDDDYYADDSYDDEDESSDDDYYDEDQKKHEDNSQVSYIYNTTRAGDQMLKIGLGLTIPMNFGNPMPMKSGKMKLGGLGSIGYHVFLKDWLSVGADLGFGFNSTIASNLFNYVPLIATATFQPSFRNFEFPISVGVGFAWETYNTKSYWPGLVFRAEAGVRYKITQNWGVGGNVSYILMPQFGELWNTGKNEVGKFTMISAVANYYF